MCALDPNHPQPPSAEGAGRCVHRSAALSLIAAVLLSGCGPDFPELSEIYRVNILGLRADPPWIMSGQTSRLTPLIEGATAPDELTFRWSWCPLRGPNSARFECLFPPESLGELTGGEVSLDSSLGEGPTAEFENIFDASDVETACQELRMQEEISALVTVPECDGTFPISIRLEVADGDVLADAYKDVTLVYDPAQVADINTNPEISALGIRVLDGSELARGPLEFDRQYVLEVGSEPDGSTALLDGLSERYLDRSEDPPVETRERLVFSWSTFEGTFDADRTGFLPDTVQSPEQPDGTPVEEEWREARTNGWRSPLAGDFPGGPTTIFAVVRDNRGGQSWTSTTVIVREAPSE